MSSLWQLIYENWIQIPIGFESSNPSPIRVWCTNPVCNSKKMALRVSSNILNTIVRVLYTNDSIKARELELICCYQSCKKDFPIRLSKMKSINVVCGNSCMLRAQTSSWRFCVVNMSGWKRHRKKLWHYPDYWICKMARATLYSCSRSNFYFHAWAWSWWLWYEYYRSNEWRLRQQQLYQKLDFPFVFGRFSDCKRDVLRTRVAEWLG